MSIFGFLDALGNPQPWADDALCAQTDPEIFFPEKCGGIRAMNEAKRVCRRCPVRAVDMKGAPGGTGECLEYAMANGERFGVWGGLSERERRKLKQRRRETWSA